MTAISVDPACCLTEPTKASSPQKICTVSEKSTALLNDSDINNIVERKLRSNNFRVLQWSLDSMGETNGFLGSYYTLAVTVKIGDKSRQLKFFAKTPPPIKSPQYDFLIRSDTLNKEMIVYSEVMPRMGIGSSSKWLPDFYLGKKSTIIVLEDATQEGYIMPDKYIAFDEDHCILAAKTLSSLHSRSLILDEKLRRSTGQTMFDVYGHVLEEVAFMKNDLVGNKYLSSCVVGACTMVDLVKGLKNDEATAIKEWIQLMIPRLPDLLVPSSKFRNVMCHRDVWANNMMFKTDSAGKPIGCYLVDFQFLRYSPPALDFVICFFLTTDRATRRRCYNRLIDVYYDSMSKELSSEGLDVEECLPRSQFVESCHELKEISLTYSIANMQIMLLNKDAVEEYFIGNCEKLEEYMYGNKRADLVLDQCRNARTFQSRITEIIEEIRELLATDTRRR